jgi:hypothetical protein
MMISPNVRADNQWFWSFVAARSGAGSALPAVPPIVEIMISISEFWCKPHYRRAGNCFLKMPVTAFMCYRYLNSNRMDWLKIPTAARRRSVAPPAGMPK